MANEAGQQQVTLRAYVALWPVTSVATIQRFDSDQSDSGHRTDIVDRPNDPQQKSCRPTNRPRSTIVTPIALRDRDRRSNLGRISEVSITLSPAELRLFTNGLDKGLSGAVFGLTPRLPWACAETLRRRRYSEHEARSADASDHGNLRLSLCRRGPAQYLVAQSKDILISAMGARGPRRGRRGFCP